MSKLILTYANALCTMPIIIIFQVITYEKYYIYYSH